jgi:hypothetical protein
VAKSLGRLFAPSGSKMRPRAARRHVVPVLLGDGVRLFGDHLGSGQVELECTRMIESPAVTHLRYRVVK